MMQYKSRGSLKKTLPGPYYQILVALDYIFTALDRGNKFNIKLEELGLGAWDDIVIDYFDSSRKKIRKTRYIQVKFSKNNKKSMEIHKYFDDWSLFIKDRLTAVNAKIALPTPARFSIANPKIKQRQF
jgi:hypothetical protein